MEQGSRPPWPASGLGTVYSLIEIKRTIASLKHPTDFQAIPRIPVVWEGQIVMSLRPVPAELKGEASSDARLMAAWRNLHQTAFFTWMTSTEDSTRRWLTERYGPSNEWIIFMLETCDGVPFGHLDLSNFQCDSGTCELGRVLRGPAIGPDGGMTLGGSALMNWAACKLGVQRFFLRVFSDNQKAISLYARLGFRETATMPMRRVETGSLVRWEEIGLERASSTKADGYAVRMETRAERLRWVS